MNSVVCVALLALAASCSAGVLHSAPVSYSYNHQIHSPVVRTVAIAQPVVQPVPVVRTVAVAQPVVKTVVQPVQPVVHTVVRTVAQPIVRTVAVAQPVVHVNPAPIVAHAAPITYAHAGPVAYAHSNILI